MPLGRSDADRGLDLLWEFHREAQDEAERAAYAEAISSLHSYLTDLLPASQPTLRARAGRDGFVDVHPRQEAPARSVEIRCREGERLGLFIDYVSVSKLGGGGGVSPVVVSLVRPGSAAEREGSLSRGDQLLEVDGRPLAHVSLERARWLLDTAERRGVVRLTTVPLALIDSMKLSVSREDLLNSLSESTDQSMSHSEPHRAVTQKKQQRWRFGKGRTLERVTSQEMKPRTSEPEAGAVQRQSERETAFQREGDGEGERRGSRRSFAVAQGREGELSRTNSSSSVFQRRKVRKMHIMKGAHGLGLRIIGGKGSKHGNIGIFIRDVEQLGAAYNDRRLKPGDEILMVDGKSLVGLTHAEAVGVLKTTQQLVQLVVATEVSEDQSMTSSMASIPEWAIKSASKGPPPFFPSSSPHSLSPLSTGFIEQGMEVISPEFDPSPQRQAFSQEKALELRALSGHLTKRKLPSGEDVRETEFSSASFELPVTKAQRLSEADETGKGEPIKGEVSVKGEIEIMDIVLEKKEGQSLGFTVCRGNGIIDGIFVRAVDPTGVAGRDGSLMAEDQLLEANGRSLTGLTHKQSASVIRGLKAGKVILRVCRKLARPPSEASSVAESSSTEMEASLNASNEAAVGQQQTTEKDEVTLGPPPPLPTEDDTITSGSDTEAEGSPSPPPTPPASVPPGAESTEPLPPPPPVSPLPSHLALNGEESDTLGHDQTAKDEDVERAEANKQLAITGDESKAGEREISISSLARVGVSVESSGSDSKEEGRLVTKEKVVVKQTATSQAENGLTKIELSGSLTDINMSGFIHQPQSDLLLERAETEETGASEDNSHGAVLQDSTDVQEESRESEQGSDQEEVPLGFQKFVFQMKKRAGSGLGVTIIHSIGKTKGLYMIRRIMAGGVAARDKRLKPGDRLVAINSKSLRDLSHSEVLQAINDAPREIHLEIWRDPDFELDATSSLYSIGSRSSILSDEDTEDSSTKRTSLERLLSQEGARRARGSPMIARYSASIADQILSKDQPSPGMPKRWSAVILSPNVGPAGEPLPTPSPPHTSPTHTCNTPPNPLPSPVTLTPSPAPPSLSPSPEPSSDITVQPSPTTTQQVSDHSDSDGSDTPPPPPPASLPPPIPHQHTSHTKQQQKEENGVFEGKEVERPKSLGPIPKGARIEHGPFEIEITKGIFGLGLALGMSSVGMIVIQALTSRSPIRKEGNIRVGDHLLSVNDHSLIGVSVGDAENIIKGLPRGMVRFVAMAPPRDVTRGGFKSGGNAPIKSSTSPTSHHHTLTSPPPPPPPVSPLPEAIDEPGIIKAQLKRSGNSPLGLVIEGGSESALSYIFVKAVRLGSPAHSCGKFVRGDQLVTVGNECLIGMTLVQAEHVLNTAPTVVEVVAQRKELAKQSPTLVAKSERPREEERETAAPQVVGEEREEKESVKERETRLTESLQFSEKQRETEKPTGRFQRSMSHTDMWMTESGLGGSTSLGYANTDLSASLNISRTGTLRSKTSSIENLRGTNTDGYQHSGILQGPTYYVEQPPPKPAEETIEVEIHRDTGHKLGLSIVGGSDNPSLQEVHVKKVLPDGLVFKDGRIRRGDRILSVNGHSLLGLTNKEALKLLKDSGDTVQLEVARRLGQRSQGPSPFHSQLQSRHSSGESTREPPSPLLGVQREATGGGSAPHTPPMRAPTSTLKLRSRRVSLSSQMDDEEGSLLRSKPATMPRKLKSTEGVKIVELQKGPTGLGLHLKGGTDEKLPIIVREVFPGGVAHRSGKIFPGDVIIEVNNDSFEALTHREALQKLKSYPQGKISLLVRDRMATLPRKTIPEHSN